MRNILSYYFFNKNSCLLQAVFIHPKPDLWFMMQTVVHAFHLIIEIIMTGIKQK